MTTLERAWRWGGHAFKGAALVGLGVAVGNPAVGLAIVSAALFGVVATHVVVSAVNYRRVMSRPWPQARAAVDEDDW